MSTDRENGLYDKYHVLKRDTLEPVTVPTFTMTFTDPHAWPALRAYADSCEAEYPQLAADLRAYVANCEASAKGA